MKYKPYLMKDVYAGEALNKFRVISTFMVVVVHQQDIDLQVERYLQSMSLLKKQEILTEIIILIHLYLTVTLKNLQEKTF